MLTFSCLSVGLYIIYLLISLSTCIGIYLTAYIFLSLSLSSSSCLSHSSICLSTCLSIYLSLSIESSGPCIYLSAISPFIQSIYLLACPSIYVSIYLSATAGGGRKIEIHRYTDTPIPPSHAPIHRYTDPGGPRERSAQDCRDTPIHRSRGLLGAIGAGLR